MTSLRTEKDSSAYWTFWRLGSISANLDPTESTSMERPSASLVGNF
jgi:hypothetical protein